MPFKLIETSIKNLYLIEFKRFSDERGHFFESFNRLKLSDSGVDIDFIQDNVSKSKKGVLRGLHYQIDPFSQTKLLTVLNGRILDVAVDLRKKSPTFGKYLSFELSSEDNTMLLIPKGFAHGFIALCDDTVIQYKCDRYYSPAHERGILFKDSNLNIDWKYPEKDMIIAKRDLNFQSFLEAENNFVFEG
ncbi:TPA: dTDP-4-dehydrorhamnose 3,5-epimerase [Candidatus Delongbacteria bacterium]|nr:dTDP-4-dehydrorhamnose 3,5-epimerase [Candidatus Delongbacteria bacterium]